MEYFLTGEAGERRKFVEAFEEFCRNNYVPDNARHAADLALEEHLTNVLNYGFRNGSPHRISVSLSIDKNALEVRISDNGKAYNPLSAPEPDISLPLDEKPIGGLGVYLMKQSMDELSYAREGNLNVLRMMKRFGK